MKKILFGILLCVTSLLQGQTVCRIEPCVLFLLDDYLADVRSFTLLRADSGYYYTFTNSAVSDTAYRRLPPRHFLTASNTSYVDLSKVDSIQFSYKGDTYTSLFKPEFMKENVIIVAFYSYKKKRSYDICIEKQNFYSTKYSYGYVTTGKPLVIRNQFYSKRLFVSRKLNPLLYLHFLRILYMIV